MLFDYEKEKKPLPPTDKVKALDGSLYIPKGLWREIITTHEKEEVLAWLKGMIDRGEITFPYRVRTSDQALSVFRKLKVSEAHVVEGAWSCNRLVQETPLLYSGSPRYVPISAKLGSELSDLFTQEVRMSVGHQRFLSPRRAWGSTKKAFLNYLFNEGMFEGDLDNRALRTALSMRSYIASQFKPESAKVIYDTFQAKKVLDFSAGWGDRLVGFLASGAESYIGIDPNTKLQDPYRKIVDLSGAEKETRFICSPAEEADLTGVEVDFVFTSPPYFTLERYSDEETQSWKRYPKIEEWLEGFLFPTLDKCWSVLSEGGRILVNVADAYTNGEREEICQPMLRHMESLGATYEGVLGYQMGGRPGANMENVGEVFCEPIWVWSKGEASEPKWTQETLFGV